MRAKQKFMKGTFRRRVFSILMALAMVITLMPMNAMEVKAADVIKAQLFTLTHNSDGTYTVTDVTVPEGHKLYAGAVTKNVFYDDYWGNPSEFYDSYLGILNLKIDACPIYEVGLDNEFDVVEISPGTSFSFTENGVPDAGILISVAKARDERGIYPALTLGMTPNPAVGESLQNRLDTTKIQITSMTLNVDWSKIPTLTVGQSAPRFTDNPATASGIGVYGIIYYGWAVKALQSHVTSGYISQDDYNEYAIFDHWMPLSMYKDYTINATDTYACFILPCASGGYRFADATGVDLTNNVTSNVNVAQILSDDGGSSAVAFLKLGTVSDIEDAKGGATSTEHTITISSNIQNGTIRTNVQKQVAGQNVTVSALPNSGYYLYSLKANDVDLMSQVRDDGGEKVCTFEMPNEDVTITAEFKPKTSIETVELTVDKSKLPELTAGAALPDIETSPASVSGNLCSVKWCAWVVKNGDSWVFVDELDDYTLQSEDEIALCIYLVADEKYVFDNTISGTLNGTETVTIEPDTRSHGWAASVYMEVENPASTPDPGEHTHTIVTDAAVAPTCTEAGKTEGSHCSVCNTVIKEQKEVPAHGHDWSNDWVITKLATATTEGKKECTCKREGCNQKKYEVIPVIGTPADPNEGKLDKDAEVAPKAPIEEATLDNTKTELLSAPAIFTATEKQAIDNGAYARVWMEVSKTDESSIPSADKTKISDAATSIMGENPAITYFDADLFKQVGAGAATQLHEPGIDIEVTIKVPETLRNADSSFEREYKIIRLHTDVATGASLVDILSGTFDKITGEFKFKTDKFSTYAIAYTDKKLVTGVTLTPETATLTQAGQSVQLTATVAPADATDKSVTWTSSNTKVATVDANGKVTAVANGTCTITVTTVDGSKSATSTITVKIPATESGNSGNSTDNTGNTGNTNNTNNNQTQNSTVTNTSDKSDKKDVISAKTGDSNAPILWTSVLLMSMTALAILFTRRKRNAR